MLAPRRDTNRLHLVKTLSRSKRSELISRLFFVAKRTWLAKRLDRPVKMIQKLLSTRQSAPSSFVHHFPRALRAGLAIKRRAGDSSPGGEPLRQIYALCRQVVIEMVGVTGTELALKRKEDFQAEWRSTKRNEGVK